MEENNNQEVTLETQPTIEGETEVTPVVEETPVIEEVQSVDGFSAPVETQPAEVVIDAEKAKDWIAKGVQPTETVKSLLVNAGVIEKSSKLSPAKTKTRKKK